MIYVPKIVPLIFGEFGTQKWFRRNQYILLFLLNNPIPKVREFFRENIIGVCDFPSKVLIGKITPNSVHYQVDKDVRAANFYSLDCHSNHIRKNFFVLLNAFHKFDLKFANPFVPALNLGYDTLTANSTTADGYVSQNNADWATVHNATDGAVINNTAASYSRGAGSCDYSSSKIFIYRSYYYFDTSSMGSGKTISLAQFSLRGVSAGGSSISVQQGTQEATLTTADYDSFTGNSFGVSTGWSSGYNDITLDTSGKTYVNNSNDVRLCAREYDHDYLDSTSDINDYLNSCYFAEQGAGYYPKLYIEYSAGGGGAVGNSTQIIYHVREAIGSSKQIVYNVREKVGSTKQFIYNVREAIGNATQIIYNVREKVGNTTQIIYNVRQTVGNTFQFIYNVLGVLVSVGNTFQFIYHTREKVGKTFQFIYNTLSNTWNDIIYFNSTIETIYYFDSKIDLTMNQKSNIETTFYFNSKV